MRHGLGKGAPSSSARESMGARVLCTRRTHWGRPALEGCTSSRHGFQSTELVRAQSWQALGGQEEVLAITLLVSYPDMRRTALQ